MSTRQTQTALIRDARPQKNTVNPWTPYHFLVEPECAASRQVEDVATVFLTNRECPFTCLMCDLWKNTTDETVPDGAIPAQIDYALQRLPPARHIKLYNSGNFFDPKAIPRADWPAIAELVCRFETVVVENHPKFCDDRCLAFQQLLEDASPDQRPQLEIAIGLENSHEPTLATLNKQMTTADFARACEFLIARDIRIRSFVLLRPPGLSEEQGVEQAIESVRFAFNCGVDCVAVIPTRSGNGILDQLKHSGDFTQPTLRSLERVMDETIEWKRGRVFADLWDAERFSRCHHCRDTRIERMRLQGLTQKLLPGIDCDACKS